MSKRIHFEDDIFYISLLIRNIRDALALDIDPELFVSRFADEVGFVDDVLAKLLAYLTDNERFIERDEQLANLGEAEGRFASALNLLQSGRGTVVEALAPFAERIAEWRAASLARTKTIDELLYRQGGAESDNSAVSSFEMNELLKDLD
jgi:hypothetical protein